MSANTHLDTPYYDSRPFDVIHIPGAGTVQVVHTAPHKIAYLEIVDDGGLGIGVPRLVVISYEDLKAQGATYVHRFTPKPLGGIARNS